jgi:DNA mismatch repair protein MutL
MSINILSQETVNKIAAGEVIERPLNVVKELVENSLDAFASSIIVEILGAGKRFIRVSDNGSGMNEKDLELSILRHATSKIKDFSDLAQVYSLGFRGEALASIVTVSNFKIKTRKKGEPSGWELSSEGGKDVKIIPWAGAEGTVGEVENLFFNTPVRQKFLKSDSTERSRIVSSLEETALANQEIAFKMISENRTIFSTSKTNNKMERISDILGKDFSKAVKNVKFNHSKISLDIYFTTGDCSLPNRKYQYLFVNSRPVNYPKWLLHCIYQVYKEFIQHDKHPGILIYVNIDPAEIDVNIHPTKREIKFANENSIYNVLFKLLNSALMEREYSKIPINLPINGDNKSSSNERCSEYISNSFSVNKLVLGSLHSDNYVSEPNPKRGYTVSKQTYNIEQYVNVFARQVELPDESFNDIIRIIGQIFNTYIIVENENNLYIFDQHAVAERVRYELYLFQIKNQAVKIQQMLIPKNFDLLPSFSELLKANIAIFNELGISVEEFGQNSFRVTGYPALLGSISIEQIEQIVKAIISDIENDKDAKIEQIRDRIVRSACHASVKAGDKITFTEAEKLINDLFKCKLPFTCPHGRPVAYKMSLKELEKFFKRR